MKDMNSNKNKIKFSFSLLLYTIFMNCMKPQRNYEGGGGKDQIKYEYSCHKKEHEKINI